MKPLIIKEFIADVKKMAELVDMTARFRNDQDKRKRMISLLKNTIEVYHYKYFESDEISMGAKPFIVRINGDIEKIVDRFEANLWNFEVYTEDMREACQMIENYYN